MLFEHHIEKRHLYLASGMSNRYLQDNILLQYAGMIAEIRARHPNAAMMYTVGLFRLLREREYRVFIKPIESERL